MSSPTPRRAISRQYPRQVVRPRCLHRAACPRFPTWRHATGERFRAPTAVGSPATTLAASPPVGQGPPARIRTATTPRPRSDPEEVLVRNRCCLARHRPGTESGLGHWRLHQDQDKQPQPETIFSSGRSTSVHLDPENRKILFIAGAAQAGGHPVHCIAAGAGGGASASNAMTAT